MSGISFSGEPGSGSGPIASLVAKAIGASGGDALTQEQVEAKSASEANGNMKKGGKVTSASKRADGIAVRGKTRGKMI